MGLVQVGLVVGRNMDRGDAKKLPPDQLDLCEIEPLRQEETGSDRCCLDDSHAMHLTEKVKILC